MCKIWFCFENVIFFGNFDDNNENCIFVLRYKANEMKHNRANPYVTSATKMLLCHPRCAVYIDVKVTQKLKIEKKLLSPLST